MNRGAGRFILRVVVPVVLVLGVLELAGRGVGFDVDAWLERHSVLELLGSLIGFGVVIVVATLAITGAVGLLEQAFGRRKRGLLSRLGSFVGALFAAAVALVLVAGLIGSLRDPGVTP